MLDNIILTSKKMKNYVVVVFISCFILTPLFYVLEKNNMHFMLNIIAIMYQIYDSFVVWLVLVPEISRVSETENLC